MYTVSFFSHCCTKPGGLPLPNFKKRRIMKIKKEVKMMKTKEECGTWHARQFLVLMGSFNKTWFLQETRILLSLLQGWYIIFMNKQMVPGRHMYFTRKLFVSLYASPITITLLLFFDQNENYELSSLHQFIWWVRHHSSSFNEVQE